MLSWYISKNLCHGERNFFFFSHIILIFKLNVVKEDLYHLNEFQYYLNDHNIITILNEVMRGLFNII